MRYYIFPTLIVFFLLPGPGSGQSWFWPGPPQPAPRMSEQEVTIIAQYWVHSYLRRPARPEDARFWAEQILRSRHPADALTALLSSPEYINYAGGTQRALVRQLILDVGHREPSRFEIEQRLAAMGAANARDIAYAFLREFPANWWPGPHATPPPELQHLYPGPHGIHRNGFRGVPPFGR